MKFLLRMSSLYGELNYKSKASLLYHVFFMLRRLLFAFSAVILTNWPFLQIQTLILQSIFMIIFITTVKPFEDSFMNKLELFNELCILGVSYHLILFTNFNPDVNNQYLAGWSIIGITMLNVITNMSIMIGKSVIRLLQTIKRVIIKCKESRAKKYIINP